MKLKIFCSLLSVLVMLVSAGCSARKMQESADTQVREIIQEKSEGITEHVLPEEALEYGGASAEPVEISLEDALVMSAENNRTYISRREDVYMNILDLTYQRYRYGTRYRVTGGAEWGRDSEGDETLSARFNARLLRVLATGAEITFDVTQDFLRYLTGDRDTDLQTIVNLNLLQPLLRGAGREVAMEDLVQAERDAVYSIRAFLRFQKGFSVDASERYFNLLMFKSRMENFHNNYESLKRTRERIEMLAEAGRLPGIQVDQARQNEFDARQRWVTSINRYEAAVDDFKMHLGLSPGAEISLDDKLLDVFIERGVLEIDVELEEFLEQALSRRLDLLTRYERLEDSGRKVDVAGNRLRTGLDLRLGTRASTERDSSLSFDFGTPSYSAGLELEVPVDRMSERNQYVRALISRDRAEREFIEMMDTVRLEVVRQYRNLEEAYQSYVIQKNSLDLARDRIESIGLLLEAGRATTRDLLEAEEAYLRAQNELVSEIINHTMAYLRFMYSAELLEVDEKGVWRGEIYEEITEADSN